MKSQPLHEQRPPEVSRETVACRMAEHALAQVPEHRKAGASMLYLHERCAGCPPRSVLIDRLADELARLFAERGITLPEAQTTRDDAGQRLDRAQLTSGARLIARATLLGHEPQDREAFLAKHITTHLQAAEATR